jgi:polysaccharide pyruvyl transferase WcaK-like protein
MTVIVIAAEMHSANLGDRLIFDCLRHLVLELEPQVEVIPIDLSYQQPGAVILPAGQVPLHKRLTRFGEHRLGGWYAPVNALLNWLRDLCHAHQRTAWLSRADLLLIGGGQLLMDNRLGFPVKLANLTGLARHRQLPYALVACGVGRQWSPSARYLFGRVLRHAESVSVRDSFSQERLAVELRAGADLCPDPVLAAPLCYPPEGYPDREPIGLCPMNPDDFLAAQAPGKSLDAAGYRRWWLDLLYLLEQHGQPWQLFTNGVPQDRAFVQQLLHAAGFPEAERLAELAVDPAQFCRQLQTFSRILGTRMHPILAAHAYGIPAVGAAWDAKLEAYFNMVGRSADLIHAARCAPVEVADHLLAAEAPSAERLAGLRCLTRDHLRKVLSGVRHRKVRPVGEVL